MNAKQAWAILADSLDHGYEGDECEEMEDYINDFEEAIEVIEKLVKES